MFLKLFETEAENRCLHFDSFNFDSPGIGGLIWNIGLGFKSESGEPQSDYILLPRVCSIQFAIFSLSDKMSARHLVPRTFLEFFSE